MQRHMKKPLRNSLSELALTQNLPAGAMKRNRDWLDAHLDSDDEFDRVKEEYNRVKEEPKAGVEGRA